MLADEHSSEESALNQPEMDPIFCQLANGHAIKIEAAHWSRWRTYEDWASRFRPEPYFAIRIYCTEDTLPKRLVRVEEYCEGTDFMFLDFDGIWVWLQTFCESRDVYSFDAFSEFQDFISDQIIELSTPDSDVVEHLKHLPEITDPNAFDKVDDSIYNDQNEPT